jgi:hypothetical protein
MKAVAVFATTGDRKKQLKQAAKSIIDQVEHVHIYDNSKQKDLTDNAKFILLGAFSEPVYYFSCDDDILYPKDYVERTIQEIEKHGTIVSWHGRILTEGAHKYYGSSHQGFRFFQGNKLERLDVAGTGVTAFRTDYFEPTNIATSSYKCMSDLVFSLEAWQQNKVITLPEKKAGWINDIPVKSSIFKRERNGEQKHQIELMNKILECKRLNGYTQR